MSAWLGKASAKESKTTVKEEIQSIKKEEKVKEEMNTNPLEETHSVKAEEKVKVGINTNPH